MPEICLEVKIRALLAAGNELERKGGSAEYERAFRRAIAIILGDLPRKPLAGVDEDRIMTSLLAQLATEDSIAAAGRPSKVTPELGQQFVRQWSVHFKHQGCRAALLAVHDLAGAGKRELVKSYLAAGAAGANSN